MKKRSPFFAMFLLLLMVCGGLSRPVPARGALLKAGSSAVIAEKVLPSDLQAGDQLVILCESNDMALCTGAVTSARLSSGKASTGDTATRKVLTALPDNAAVFTLSEAEDGWYLHCSAGYLTSSATGNALFYAQDLQEGSRWKFVNDVFLYNPAACYTSDRNYYVEFFSSYFTIYGKSSSANQTAYTMSFYRMGNSLPDEPLLQDSYYYLPVYETSDAHGYLANVTDDGQTQYLMAYISDRLNAARAGGRDKAVVLDGGDIYQGTTLSNLTHGNSLSAAYALMEYDAVTVGNHEFDWGLDTVIDSDGTMMDYALGDNWQGVNSTPVVISNLYQNGSKVSWGRDNIILDKTAVDPSAFEGCVVMGE